MNHLPKQKRARLTGSKLLISATVFQAVFGIFPWSENAPAGNIWTGGGGSTNWSDNNNWGGAAPTYGTLTFTTGGAQGTTSNNNSITSMNQLLWTGTASWILNGITTLSLFDNGGVQAKIENQSTGSVTINDSITFAANNGSPPNPFGEINAVNGDITFGAGTLTVNGSSVNGIKLFGSNHTATFNNTVSASGKWFGMTATNDIMAIGGTFTSGDIYVMNGGTLKVNSGASITTSALRLGGDLGNTGNQNQTLGGTLQFTVLSGGQSFGSTINTVTGNTSTALLIDSQNTSNTNTITGNIFLDSDLAFTQASGGTLSITNATLDLKARTLSLRGAGGTINITAVIGNSSGSGQLVVGTDGSASSGGTVVLSNANTYSGETFVRNGTLAFTSAGSAADSTIRLGSTSGSSVDASVNLTTAGGGTTISSTINPVGTSGSGTLSLNSQNTSGTNTYSGHIGMDRNFSITQAAGGNLIITQGRLNSSNTVTAIDTKDKTLTFTGGGNFAVGAASPTGFGTIYDSGVGANGSVVMAGTGLLSLNDANTYRGGTTVKSGTLFVGANNALGSSNGTVGTTGAAVLLGDTTGSSNATLLTTGAFTVANAITLQSGNTGVITIGGNSANASIFSGAVKLGTASGTAKNGVFVSLSGGSADFQGVITENTSVPASSVTIGDAAHAGTVKFSNPLNGYGGATTVGNGATLEVVNLGTTGNSSIGNATRSIGSNLVLSNGTLKYTGAGESTSRSFTFDANGGALDVSAVANAALTLTGTASASGTGNRTLTLTGTSTGANTLQSVVANPTSGATALTKSGAGTWILSSPNIYSGATNVNQGILQVNTNNALGTTTGSTTVSSGAALKLNAVSYSTAESVSINGTGVSNGGALVNSGTSSFAGQITAATNATINAGVGTLLTLTGGLVKNGTTLTITGGGIVNVNTVGISGAGANSDLVVDGVTVNENASNSYNGPTYIRNAGTLNANVTNALPTANGRTAVTMDDTGSGNSNLTLGASQSAASLTGASTSTVSLGVNTLTIGTSSGTTAFAGGISGTGGGITKDGASTQRLAGATTFTGTTIIGGGTLEASAAGALGATASVSVNSGGTLLLSGSGNRINNSATITLATSGTGAFNTGGLSETVGALTMTANSIIDMGATGASLLTFANAGSIAWTGTLSIWNWSGTPVTGGGTDRLLLTSSANNGNINFANINFFSDAGITSIGFGAGFIANGLGGEIVPVPEPSSVATAMGLLGLIGWRERRKMQRERVADRRMILA